MEKTLAARVASYAERDRIRDFVRRALRARAPIADLLSTRPAERLVVVKPNWIQESHEYAEDVWLPVITHPALILAIVEELSELMGGRGTVAICDAPHTYADFDRIVSRGEFLAGVRAIRASHPRLAVELLDLRREVWRRRDGVVVDRRPNAEDPRGYVRVDLGRDSLLCGHAGAGRYYGADYDTRVVNAHHRGERHEYLLAGTPMKCDVFINVPKLKTHKKTGLTCCLKNLVGINGDKNWLPHFTEGAPETGGDEYPDWGARERLEARLRKALQRAALRVPGLGTWAYRKARRAGMSLLGDSERTVRAGNWWGNDTCWRMALDLNRALLYADGTGAWNEGQAVRPYLAFVDGIVAGEGNGPLAPRAVEARVLVCGDNPVVVDAVCARLMGYDPALFPIVREAWASHRWPLAPESLEGARLCWDEDGRQVPLANIEPAAGRPFELHFGWRPLAALGASSG